MAVTEWDGFVRQCLLNRVSPTDFAAQVRAKQGLKPKLVFQALLDARATFCLVADPLPSRYLEQLLFSDTGLLSDVLIVLVLRFNHSRSRKESISDGDVLSLQETSSLLLNSKISPSSVDTRKCLLLSSKWLTAVVNLIKEASNTSTTNLAESLSSFLSTLSATTAGIQVVSTKKDEGKDADTIDSVAHAVSLALGLFPPLSVQTTDRLGAVQKHISMFGEASHTGVDVEVLQFQANVVETPMLGSREGTMAYLEAMVGCLGGLAAGLTPPAALAWPNNRRHHSIQLSSRKTQCKAGSDISDRTDFGRMTSKQCFRTPFSPRSISLSRRLILRQHHITNFSFETNSHQSSHSSPHPPSVPSQPNRP